VTNTGFGVLLPVRAWLRNPALRSWPLLLFIALVAVPPVGLVIIATNGTVASFDDASWLFAAYFAVAWLLLIGVIVRPAQVTRRLLALVVIAALVTQVPIALAIETTYHASTKSLASSVFVIGLAEELAKALPVVAIALLLRSRLSPVDYLFLGAVSGLVFGASEVQRYITTGTNLPPQGAPVIEVAVAVLNYVWRFLTDPISHACWAGLSGYFIGLTVTGRYRWWTVGWIGLLTAMILHGLNDWDPWNGKWPQVAVVAVSAVLFVGYAKAGPAPVPAALPAAPAAAPPGAHMVPAQAPPAPSAVPPPAVPRPEQRPAAEPARSRWWQSLTTSPPAMSVPGQSAAPRRKPWWEE
jgi:RsiW-degrading membrane proteinase PrsW (M82 family)